jgi:hypothetical protein
MADPRAAVTGAHDDGSVADYLASLDDRTARDSQVLIEMMQRISGQAPRLWNVGTLGFGTYHYKYDSGREGDSHTLGFYPRKGKITVYLMDGTARHAAKLADLGTHTASKVCLYIKRLSDVDLTILEQVLEQSYAYVTARDGTMHRA